MHCSTPALTPTGAAQRPRLQRRRRAQKALPTEGLPDALRRKETAQARLRELEVAQREGELIPAAEVQEAWLRIGTLWRTRMLAIPSKMAARLAAKKPAEIRALLDDEIRAAYRKSPIRPPDHARRGECVISFHDKVNGLADHRGAKRKGCNAERGPAATK